MKLVRELADLIWWERRRRACTKHGGHSWSAHTDPIMCSCCGVLRWQRT